jgi:hypothetical protein
MTRKVEPVDTDGRWIAGAGGFALGMLAMLFVGWFFASPPQPEHYGPTHDAEVAKLLERRIQEHQSIVAGWGSYLGGFVGRNHDWGYACPAPIGCWAVARKDTIWLNPMPATTGGNHVFYGQPQPKAAP